MPQSNQCPKCGGSMAEGFVLDKTHGGAGVAAWVEGAPMISLWTGVRLTGRPQTRIATWRCRRCGFLENYATGGPDGDAVARKRAVATRVAIALAAAMIVSLVVAFLSHRTH